MPGQIHVNLCSPYFLNNKNYDSVSIDYALTGSDQLPPRKIYWENSSDVLNTAVFDAMSRNCFKKLLSVLHLSDNMKLDTSDKLAKVSSFLLPYCTSLR